MKTTKIADSSPIAMNIAQREAAKTDDQRAEDIAYTINHALACTATDFIDPYFGNLTQKYLGKRFSIGCGHDHGHADHHGHDHGSPCDHHHDHHPPGRPPGHHPPQGGNLKHWWIGEVAGDFGAVPVTVALQRYQPDFMDGLRRVMEPLLGPFFRLGAKRAARSWAKEQGVGVESPETAERAEAIYRHEVDHLPQALIWTASSITINLATQKLLGNKGPLWQLAAGKTVGAGISAGLVVGGRGLAPDLARNWDQFTSKTLFLPATKAVGGWFGVQGSAVDGMVERQERLKGRKWAERVEIEEDGRPAGLGA